MKKAVSLALVLILALGMMSIGALADGGAVITAASVTDAKVGDTISVPVSITGNPGFAALSLKFAYDTEKLELTGIDAGELAKGAVFEPAEGMWADAKNEIGIIAANNITADGVLFTLSFKVLAAGESDVSLTLTSFGNEAGTELDAELVSGTVSAAAVSTGYTVTLDDRTGTTTPATVTGIVNGGKYDGETTFTVACDKACVVMYTTDGETYTRLTCTTAEDGTHSFTLNVTADTTVVVAIKGDVNGDGKVNGTDAMRISRAAAGYGDAFDAITNIIADVNNDEKANGTDGMRIRRVAAGYVSLDW